jgi:hypothetical protein
MSDDTLKQLVKGQNDLARKVSDLADGQHELFLLVSELASAQDKLATKTSVDKIAHDLENLKDYTYAGFDTMNTRFDRLEDQVDRLAAEIGSGGYQH